MSAFFGRFHGDTKPEPGESKGVRDAYDRMLAADPRCEHGKKPGVCRAATCNTSGGPR